jgi:hypothetical protein
VGARAGYALTTGQARAHGPLGDLVEGVVPGQLEVGWRLTPALTLGAYGSYGIGLPAHRAGVCGEPGSSCSVRDLRLGLQAAWAFAARWKGIGPWVGLAVGYEWLSLDGFDGSGARRGFRGLELACLQVGAEAALGRVRVGPVLSYSLGRYDHTRLEKDGQSASGAIEEKAFHGLWTLAIRGQLDL